VLRGGDGEHAGCCGSKIMGVRMSHEAAAARQILLLAAQFR
jgi:hypothetical protein